MILKRWIVIELGFAVEEILNIEIPPLLRPKPSDL